MKRFVILILFVLPGFWVCAFAQEYGWKADFNYFFDNMEYKKSSFAIPQTQNGIWFSPTVEVHWDSLHTLYAGVNLLTIPGAKQALEKTWLTLWYQYETPKVLFRAGAFPRREVLGNYSDFFFKDSVNHFRPLMQGIFFQIGKQRNFFNAWMDWTGYADETERESFFLGFSGKISKGMLFADFQSYLFHYSGTLPWNPQYGVSEQFQGLVSAGVEYENSTGFEAMASVGALGGVERDRKSHAVYKPFGLVVRANARYGRLGVRNTFYAGSRRMCLYHVHGDNLYWGTPFLRGKSYLQNQWYINLLQSSGVRAALNMNLHFSEGMLLFQQTLSVSASIGRFTAPGRKKAVPRS